MKFSCLIIAVLGILLLAGCAKAADITFAWDPSISTSVTGYRMYKSKASGGYSIVDAREVGNVTTYTWAGINEPGVYYFVVTAYDAIGNESGYSNEVNQEVQLPAPTGLQILKVIISQDGTGTRVDPTKEETEKVLREIKSIFS